MTAVSDSLTQKIKNYSPSVEAKQLVARAQITFLVGIAGAGKDTIMRHLLEDEGFYNIVSHTTRAPRSNNGILEQDGREYHFVSPQEVEMMVDNQAFIEVKQVHSTVYGTSGGELARAMTAGKVAITDIDVQGVDEYLAVSSRVRPIFIVPPNYQVWLERLKSRYASETEFTQEWPARRESAIKELRHVLGNNSYFFVVNNELATAVREVQTIAKSGEQDVDISTHGRMVAQAILEKLEQRV
ncbi:hypothetical protein FJZ39_03575 [Candidatus Saccharibacteria bacterium]|nr:hypothetical protein [Candidatus Saccharibacteria bacterium]